MPEFDGLGSDAIHTSEVFHSAMFDDLIDEMTEDGYGPDRIFGFAPRYAYMKCVPQQILSGD